MGSTVFGTCIHFYDVVFLGINFGFQDGQILHARQEVRECKLQASHTDKMGRYRCRGVQLNIVWSQWTAMVREMMPS